MNILKKNFNNKKVIVTGHTGFKGSWLSLWLQLLGAKVLGVSNEIVTSPSNFKIQHLKEKILSKKIDITNLNKIKKIINKYKPDYIFHLAAQSLVKSSYKNPIKTFYSNTIGTLNILESVKDLKNKCTVIIITSDKVYKNMEKNTGYKETDLIGGLDPYSASKGCAELVVNSYFNSFLFNKSNIRLGVARAGNVIGGGDWSKDRLVPDCIKSWSKKKKVILRNPNSTRPWQHVLEALGGYLIFAVKLKKNIKINGEAFNFGPSGNNLKVINLVKIMKKYWNNVSWKIGKKKKTEYESKLLELNCKKAKKLLNWKSVMTVEETSKLSIIWYKKFYQNREEINTLSIKDIVNYEKQLLKKI